MTAPTWGRLHSISMAHAGIELSTRGRECLVSMVVRTVVRRLLAINRPWR